MSYDLSIYSGSSENVLKEKLKDKLAAQGWSIAFLSPDASYGKVSVPVLPSQGPMENEVTIIGWKTKSKQAPAIKSLIGQFDIKGLEQLHNSLYGGCPFYVTNPYQWSDDYSDEEIEELETASNPDFVAAIKKARTHYHSSIRGAQGPVSFALQEAVWRAIGELQGGLIENPQSDEYEIYEPDGAGGYQMTHTSARTDYAGTVMTSLIFCLGGSLAGVLALRLLSNFSSVIAWGGTAFCFVLGGCLSYLVYRVIKFSREIGAL